MSMPSIETIGNEWEKKTSYQMMTMSMMLWTQWPLPRVFFYYTQISTELCWYLSHFRFSHKSFEPNCSTTCMSSTYIRTCSVGSWHRCSNAIMPYFFPISFLCPDSGVYTEFFLFIYNSRVNSILVQHMIIH